MKGMLIETSKLESESEVIEHLTDPSAFSPIRREKKVNDVSPSSGLSFAVAQPILRWVALVAAIGSLAINALSSLQPAKAALTHYQTGLRH